MNRLCWLVFFVIIVSCGLVACVPAKTVQELNPGVTFMGKNEVTEFLTGSEIESPNAIVTYKENGKATIYVKKLAKDVNGTWKVEDDGMVVLASKGRVDKWYQSTDQTTTYNLDGEKLILQKK